MEMRDKPVGRISFYRGTVTLCPIMIDGYCRGNFCPEFGEAKRSLWEKLLRFLGMRKEMHPALLGAKHGYRDTVITKGWCGLYEAEAWGTVHDSHHPEVSVVLGAVQLPYPPMEKVDTNIIWAAVKPNGRRHLFSVDKPFSRCRMVVKPNGTWGDWAGMGFYFLKRKGVPEGQVPPHLPKCGRCDVHNARTPVQNLDAWIEELLDTGARARTPGENLDE